VILFHTVKVGGKSYCELIIGGTSDYEEFSDADLDFTVTAGETTVDYSVSGTE